MIGICVKQLSLEEKKMSNIKLLISDFDGCLTDGIIHKDLNNDFYDYSVYDGGVKQILSEMGIKFAIVSGKQSAHRAQRCEEMKADYILLGINDKKRCVEKLACDLNLEYSAIAFFGDDINDLEAMEMCGITGCPNNATDEVKRISTFVSDKNGGEGALRTFVAFLKNSIIGEQQGDQLFQISKEIMSLSRIINTAQFAELSERLKTFRGNILTCGLGKSAIAARMVSALFATSCKPSFCVDVTMAMHGELGSITPNDCLILFSKSGNSKELIDFCRYVNRKGVYTVLVTSSSDSMLSSLCNTTFVLPIEKECYSHCLIPTTSLLQHIIFGQALIYYSSNYTTEDIEQIHPSDFKYLS